MSSTSSASKPPFDSGAKKSPIVSILVVLLILAAAGIAFYVKTKVNVQTVAGAPGAPAAGGKGGAKNAPVPVGTGEVKTGNLDVYINAIGNVRAINTITVRALVGGTLQKVYFTEGSLVKKGDRLADIDPRPFEVQKMQAEGQLARDQASLENAKRDLARYKEAAEAVTRQQIDLATSTVGQFEGAVMTDQAAVDNAKLQLTYSRITAPIAGRVGLRLVDEGNIVSTSDTTGIVVITQVQPISVVFTVPENDLRSLIAAVDKNPTLTVRAFDRDNVTALSDGKLAALDNQLDVTTGTVKLRANFDNSKSELFPNQFVNVRLLAGTRENVVLAPTVAVQISDKDRFIYVVKEGGTVERREVKTGEFDEKSTEIIEGVKAGETVVTEGLDRLRTGSKIISATKKRDDAKAAGKAAGDKAGDKTGARHDHTRKPN